LFGTFNFSTMIIIFQVDYVNYVNFIYIDIRLTLRIVRSVIFMPDILTVVCSLMFLFSDIHNRRHWL